MVSPSIPASGMSKSIDTVIASVAFTAGELCSTLLGVRAFAVVRSACAPTPVALKTPMEKRAARRAAASRRAIPVDLPAIEFILVISPFGRPSGEIGATRARCAPGPGSPVGPGISVGSGLPEGGASWVPLVPGGLELRPHPNPLPGGEGTGLGIRVPFSGCLRRRGLMGPHVPEWAWSYALTLVSLLPPPGFPPSRE